MWVVVCKETNSIFSGYIDDQYRSGKDKAETACKNLNVIGKYSYYMERVVVK